MITLRNSVQLIGRLGKESEIKTFDSGTKKASFRSLPTRIITIIKGRGWRRPNVTMSWPGARRWRS